MPHAAGSGDQYAAVGAVRKASDSVRFIGRWIKLARPRSPAPDARKRCRPEIPPAVLVQACDSLPGTMDIRIAVYVPIANFAEFPVVEVERASPYRPNMI